MCIKALTLPAHQRQTIQTNRATNMSPLIVYIFAIVSCAAAVEMDAAIVLGAIKPTTTVSPDGVGDVSTTTVKVVDGLVVGVVTGSSVVPVDTTTTTAAPVVVPDVPVVTVPPPMPPAVLDVTAKPVVVSNVVPSVTVGPVPPPVMVLATSKTPVAVDAMPATNADANGDAVTAQKHTPVPTTIV